MTDRQSERSRNVGDLRILNIRTFQNYVFCFKNEVLRTKKTETVQEVVLESIFQTVLYYNAWN